MADLFEHVRDSGFPFPGHLVHLFVGGSELHGAKVHGTDLARGVNRLQVRRNPSGLYQVP
jgi:hypothetical protein